MRLSLRSAMPDKASAVARARRLADVWGLKIGSELEGATCSVVFEATDSVGQDLVLKAPFSYVEERESWHVLRAFAGDGGVEVLRQDDESGAVLMPRLRPGKTLTEAGLSDDDATAICARLILQLRTAPIVEARTLARWCQELFEDPTNSLVDEARKVYEKLMEAPPAPMLLHGDLHHFNILSSGVQWVAIDPKGILGDPAFEIAGFMRNPVPNPPGADGMARRLRLFADLLGDPPERLWGWAFTETVLCWKQSDEGEFPASWSTASEAIWEVRREFGW